MFHKSLLPNHKLHIKPSSIVCLAVPFKYCQPNNGRLLSVPEFVFWSAVTIDRSNALNRKWILRKIRIYIPHAQKTDIVDIVKFVFFYYPKLDQLRQNNALLERELSKLEASLRQSQTRATALQQEIARKEDHIKRTEQEIQALNVDKNAKSKEVCDFPEHLIVWINKNHGCKIVFIIKEYM